jgi:hypothetical protein
MTDTPKKKRGRPPTVKRVTAGGKQRTRSMSPREASLAIRGEVGAALVEIGPARLGSQCQTLTAAMEQMESMACYWLAWASEHRDDVESIGDALAYASRVLDIMDRARLNATDLRAGIEACKAIALNWLHGPPDAQ